MTVVSAVNRDSAPASEIAAVSGVDALVDMLGPGADLGLARHLLGDVLLVEGWSTALGIVARHPAMRAVTPEGDLVSIDGVQIAQPDGAGPALLETAQVEESRLRPRKRPGHSKVSGEATGTSPRFLNASH